MLGGPHHSPRGDIEELAPCASTARPPLARSSTLARSSHEICHLIKYDIQALVQAHLIKNDLQELMWDLYLHFQNSSV
jgi:hypothetical protein